MHADYNATCVARVNVSKSVVIIRVRRDDGPLAFEPGQYTKLGLRAQALREDGADPPRLDDPEEMILRDYSITSAPYQTEYLEFIVTYIPVGDESPRLFRLSVGDRLYVGSEAEGAFTLVPDQRRIVLIATGTGIAPYMSFVRQHLPQDSTRRWVLVHGARYSWDLGYRSELALADRLSRRFTYIPTITRPDRDPYFSGLCGRLPALLESGALEERMGRSFRPDDTSVYLCGNPDMIRSATTILKARGFRDEGDDRSIHTERYW